MQTIICNQSFVHKMNNVLNFDNHNVTLKAMSILVAT